MSEMEEQDTQQAQPEPPTPAEAAPQPEVAPGVEVTPVAEAAPAAEAAAPPEPAPQPEAKPPAEAKPSAEAKPPAEPRPRPESRPEPRPTESREARPRPERRSGPPPRGGAREGAPREGQAREHRGPDRGPDRGSERGPDRGGRPDRGGPRPDFAAEIDIDKLIGDSLYLDNQAHAVVARMRDMDSGTRSQLRRLYSAIRRGCRAPESERQHHFVMLRARLAYTIARHQLRSLDVLEKLLLQVTRRNDVRCYERFRDLFEAIVAYNE
ncbi:MAG: type III-A CRISPR-associated protein Csm2 [Bryobacteraceae bacterium]|jgi:CRISPR type III-A-associated protein Csm2